MASKIYWTKSAVIDFRKAYQYISAGGLYNHREVADSIDKTVFAVSKDPTLGKSIRTKQALEIKVPASPFVIAYRENAGNLEVLSVFHKSRAWP